jgi:hypothetical protein
MVLGESKMVENVKNTGSNPEAEEIFVADPAEGVYVKAVFYKNGVLRWAVVNDEKNDFVIRLMNNGERVIFDIARHGFKARLEREMSIITCPVLTKEGFAEVYRSPMDLYKAVLSAMASLLGSEYEAIKEM